MAKTAHFKEGKSKKGLKELASRLNKNHGRGSVEINFQGKLDKFYNLFDKDYVCTFHEFQSNDGKPLVRPMVHLKAASNTVMNIIYRRGQSPFTTNLS